MSNVNNTLWQRQRDYVLEHSAFYQRLWQGTAPPENLSDIAALPLTDKAMLRESQATFPPYGDYLASSPQKIARMHRTSGTTGQAMNLALSRRDCEVTEEVGGRCQSLAGLNDSHTVIHCLNYQMWMGGLTDHLTLERTGATVVPFGVGNTELLIRTILDIGVNAISCTPSYPAVILQTLTEKFPGVAPDELGLKLGLFGGEAGLDDDALRNRIRETWGLEPRNANYGVSDVFCNFAAQCTLDSRLHFMASDVMHAELIDPQTGQSLAMSAGNQGELVLTHLERECQPLVRFRTGDIIAVDETQPCECGHSGMRFRVIGRSDDMVVVRGINVFPTMVSEVASTFKQLSGDFRIVLDSKPPHDVLPLALELAPGFVETVDLRPRVTVKIKRTLGVTAQIELVPHGSFGVTEGKTRRVIRTNT